MGKITLILGGARSGKSSYAVRLAKESGAKRIAFVATCEPKDKEMTRRIGLHKLARPRHWRTFEEPLDVSKLAKRISKSHDLVLIDCVTLLVSNMMLSGKSRGRIFKEAEAIAATLKAGKAPAIIVSNEVGLGIVPENGLARDFRDVAGRVNGVIAKMSDRVVFMISGIPMEIKGDGALK